jgi:transposase
MEELIMPRPVSIPVRRAMYQQWKQGGRAPQIALRCGVAVRTVRHLLQRFAQHGEAGIAAAYRAGRRPTPPLHERIRQAAIELRREHPTWGAPLIGVMLRGQHAADEIPSARTLQRWFAAAGLAPAPRGRRPATESSRACQPHEVWQIDASESIALGTGRRVSWLRVVDEHTGAVLATRVFPPRSMESGVGPRGPGVSPRGVYAVGSAQTNTGGQRLPVGIGG